MLRKAYGKNERLITKENDMEWIDFLKVMIVDEKGAIAKYKQAASKATDSGLKKMFTEMMEEEKIHVQLIEDKIVQLQKKKVCHQEKYMK